MIKLRELSKDYGAGASRVHALQDVDLDVPAGEFVSVMGPSGSGKSTLLNLISALDTPTSGQIVIDGHAIGRLSDDALTLFRRRKIGLIFQFFNLLPTLSALDNVLLPSKLASRIAREDRERARALLSEVGLGHRLEHRVHQLSGGEMQRVAIARALMNQPSLLLADEPTGNLDSAAGRAILDLLCETRRRHGTTIVMVTHDIHAARVSDRIVSVRDGKLISDERVAPMQAAS
jgi:putative ABC transport system ATP-binding protein